MAKQQTIREQIAILMTENKGQTEKIDRIINTIDKHEETSDVFRQQVVKNTTDINGIKKDALPFVRKLIYGIYGLIGSVIVWLLGSLLVKNFVN